MVASKDTHLSCCQFHKQNVRTVSIDIVSNVIPASKFFKQSASFKVDFALQLTLTGQVLFSENERSEIICSTLALRIEKAS